MSTVPAVELRNIVKSFPGVRALDGVSFSCVAGEVHGLAGENGAGKSTLIKIMSGVYRADSGDIMVGGKKVHFTHPVDALRAGISVIYQELSLLPDRSVAQNIFLGRERTSSGLLDNPAMQREAARALDVFGSRHLIAPDRPVSELSIAEQQMVEIAKAISWDAQVIVMDEPTAALNEQECEVLFDLIDRLREQGRAVIYITHRMRELSRLADRVTVIKDGATAAAFDKMPQPSDIIRAMVGREIGDFYPEPAKPQEIGDAVLSVRGGRNARLSNIDLDLRSGEITGFAGLQGAGREALAMALFGAEPFDSGEVRIGNDKVHISRPRDAIDCGVAMLPGDRKAQGLTLMQSVWDNAMLTTRAVSGTLQDHRGNRFVDADKMKALLEKVELRAASTDVEIRSLSGGNQQKVIVARWLALAPKVLIFVEPTRGIDVNTKAAIYNFMRDLARGGVAIMMISSDLPEVIGAADRIVVMRDGKIVEEFPRGASEADVMHAATGENLESAA